LDPIHRVPANLVEHAMAYLAGDRSAVEPRASATVVLLRDGEAGLEAYLIRRHARMAFAAGMFAFPGGAVDPRDSDASVGWAGPPAAEWAARLDCGVDEARALVCAAVRETFEESGVLLASGPSGEPVSDPTGPDWEADRKALVDRSLAFTELLQRRHLVLRTDLLGYWAHWITPQFEPRRYDTRFFVAVIPEHQRARDVSGEADRVAWMRPGDATAGVDGGELAMLPPTYTTLSELGRYSRPDDVLTAARDRVVRTVLPAIAMVDGVPVFLDAGTGDD
jgi:8-oxo-dGTP pyrophosphatase MutT (NUDIX family)